MGAPRAVVDFFTNPTFAETLRQLEEQHRKETESMKAVGRGESATKFSYQTGVVDGIERTLTLLRHQRDRALQPDPEAEPKE